MPFPTAITTGSATNAVVSTVETFIQNQNLLGEVADVDEILCELVNLHKDNELALKRILQCIYRLLHNHNKWRVKFGSKLFHKLIALLVSGDGVDTRSPQLVANVLVCVQVHARKFRRCDGKFLMKQLWALSLNTDQQPHAAQILVQLTDDFIRELGMDFMCSEQLYTVLQQLLQSEMRVERKSAYFVMRKLALAVLEADENHTSIQEMLSRGGWRDKKQFEQYWMTYVTIMENLEEQQSHLVLPTLSTLLSRIAKSNQSENWISWMRIVYIKLLRDNNNMLVLRWALEYFLESFTASQLQRANVLEEFLLATNNTQLFNYEGYFFPQVKMEKFLECTEMTSFFETFVSVPWRSVPLLYWLRRLTPEDDLQSSVISKTAMLKLCACVRLLQNNSLRSHANQLVFKLFNITIEKMSLADYLLFLESLFNSGEIYKDHRRLMDKMELSANINNEITLNKRCFDIILDVPNRNEEFHTFVLEKIRQVPKVFHGWWRFIILAKSELRKYSPSSVNFLSELYDLNSSLLNQCNHLEELQKHLLSKLMCETKDERSFVLERSVDLFVSQNLNTWSEIEERSLKPPELLEMGSCETFSRLTNLLSQHCKPLTDTNYLHMFVVMVKKYLKDKNSINSDVVRMLTYGNTHLRPEDHEELARQLVEINSCESLSNILVENLMYLPVQLCVKVLLHGVPTTGDARIEAAFNSHAFGPNKRSRSFSLPADKLKLVNAELLRINNELTEQKPRYFENSKEHRIKIRIARSLLILTTHHDSSYWSDEMWSSLLAPNNQLNISYMYECLVARQLTSLHQLLHPYLSTLSTFKPSQQNALVSVAFIYCMRNWKALELSDLEEVVKCICPLTMGAHFQTRLLAQLVIHRLATECEKRGTNWILGAVLKKSIEDTFGNKFNEYPNDIRLSLPDDKCTADHILYMTNAPFDEYCQQLSNQKEFEKARLAFMAKSTKSTEEIVQSAVANVNVQRKMNPISNLYPENDFTLDDDVQENELIVVASLIDKLPNLGGLARTSEVLGVKTLVMDSKAHLDKCDFKNLSMTAEKSLKIVEVHPTALREFLLEKQSSGFKIVGAEQTAHSENFAQFKFPKKSVLLLGHEKNGIPVELIGFLDYAVEIPQFGLVRSLNVHVTGSLFIWEYCKQHLVNK